jgi:hypothetical protein
MPEARTDYDRAVQLADRSYLRFERADTLCALGDYAAVRPLSARGAVGRTGAGEHGRPPRHSCVDARAMVTRSASSAYAVWVRPPSS